MLVGVYQPNSPGSTGQLDAFASDIGFYPQVTSYYTNPFTMPFPASFVDYCQTKGTTVLIQWQPRGTSNADIAAGAMDSSIVAFADAVKSDGLQVIISYGQEMNGGWYPWGNMPGNSPAEYIAAYQRIWSLFQQEQVHNVTWLWDPNISFAGSSPLKLWYPGDKYVDWVGLDGYFGSPMDTFEGLFGPSVSELRAFTGKPLLIGETGVTGQAASAQLGQVFAGAADIGAVGVVYFDESQTGDAMHQDWRLEDNAAAMATFKQLAYQYALRPLHTAP